MLVLRSSSASPFGRKVKIAADLLGLLDRMEIRNADVNDPGEPLRVQNPLGKIPTLILEDGDALYDSRVIVEYLDHLAGGGRLIPAAGEARFRALRDQALADGILDAALMHVYEGRYRPAERREPTWLSRQQGKIDRGLAFAEQHLSEQGREIGIGAVALACALGYLDLRMAGAWRDSYPQLVAWLADFEERVPVFAKTRVSA